MKKEKILLSWSGGRDRALALHELIKSQQYDVAALVTTVTEDYDRISMHGVRRALLEQQADALGLPLEKVLITKNASSPFPRAPLSCATTGSIFGDLIPEHE